MSSFGFGKINGLQIEYINGINMNEYYAAPGTFVANKLLQKLMLQFSTSGKMIYSNQELMETFNVTRRGLQIAMTHLEAVGIVSRIFLDPETKYVRTGFQINTEMALEWLKLTRKDVEHLDRGDLKKHFVNQAVIKVNLFARKLRNIMKMKKSELERQDIQDKIEVIHAQQKGLRSTFKLRG